MNVHPCVLAVACPLCPSVKGQLCQRAGKFVAGCHAVRRTAASKIIGGGRKGRAFKPGVKKNRQ